MKGFLFLFIIITAVAVSGQTPAAIERSILRDLGDVHKFGSYSDDRDEDKNDEANERLRDTLMKSGGRVDVLRYPFPQLKNKMFVTTSKDGRLRAYSWDYETGGTMHDYGTVYQFLGKSGRAQTWSGPQSDDIEEYGAGSFVHDIFQVESKSGPIYLEVSTFIGSTSLAGQTITAARIDGEKLNMDAKLIRTQSGLNNSISFGYDFFSVVDHKERPVKLFFYDPAKSEFRFPVVIEDEETRMGRVTDKIIRYRFDGKYFVKAS
jgi:hypothetical protein